MPLIALALVMEPLGIVIRSATGMQGFQRKLGEDKIALYADDVLFFLGDTEPSLTAAMNIVEEFGRFSGLAINWEKSALLPVDPLRNSIPFAIPQLKVVERMKYLGIWLTRDPNQYISNNLVPPLLKFKHKSDIRSHLSSIVLGQGNLIKMIWMPQLLYLLHNSPVWIGKEWFKKIESLFRE